MDAAELAARASAVYGPKWQTELAEHLHNIDGNGVSSRTVQRWAADGVPDSRSAWLRQHLRAASDRRDDSEHIRGAYMAWRRGAGLRSEDIAALAESAGLELSGNRLREMGRAPSDRGRPITARELRALLGAWADQQRAA